MAKSSCYLKLFAIPSLLLLLNCLTTVAGSLDGIDIKASSQVELGTIFWADIHCKLLDTGNSSGGVYTIRWSIMEMRNESNDDGKVILGGHATDMRKCRLNIAHEFDEPGSYMLYMLAAVTKTDTDFAEAFHSFSVIVANDEYVYGGSIVPMICVLIAFLAFGSISFSYYMHVNHRNLIETANFDFRTFSSTRLPQVIIEPPPEQTSKAFSILSKLKEFLLSARVALGNRIGIGRRKESCSEDDSISEQELQQMRRFGSFDGSFTGCSFGALSPASMSV